MRFLAFPDPPLHTREVAGSKPAAPIAWSSLWRLVQWADEVDGHRLRLHLRPADPPPLNDRIRHRVASNDEEGRGADALSGQKYRAWVDGGGGGPCVAEAQLRLAGSQIHADMQRGTRVIVEIPGLETRQPANTLERGAVRRRGARGTPGGLPARDGDVALDRAAPARQDDRWNRHDQDCCRGEDQAFAHASPPLDRSARTLSRPRP